MKLGEFNSYEILPLNLTSTPPLQRKLGILQTTPPRLCGCEHLKGLEPSYFCFEDNCYTNLAKDAYLI